MRIKKLCALLISMSLFPLTTHAGLVGINSMNTLQKKELGFSIKNLQITPKEGSQALRLKASYGREGADFRLLLNGMLLLPKEGERKEPKVLVGAYGLELNESLSSMIYNELSVDYTPKKISEGVLKGDHTFSCTSSTQCNITDEIGGFNFFDGLKPRHLGPIFRPYIYGRFNYQSFAVSGRIQVGDEFSFEFLEDLSNKMLELAPEKIIYYEKSQSRPTDSLTYEEHQELADEDRIKDLGKSELEREILKNLFVNNQLDYERKIRRSSGGACTYFCPASGRFVEVTQSADTLF